MFGPGNSQLPAPKAMLMNGVGICKRLQRMAVKFDKGHNYAGTDITPTVWFFRLPLPWRTQ